MSMVRLIACDPGVMSGLAYVDFDREEGWRGELVAYEEYELGSVLWVINRSKGRDCAVVCEDFKPRPGALTWQPASLHCIGALKFHCWNEDIPFLLQTPSQRKFSTDYKLKKIGWYDIGMKAYRRAETSHPQALEAVRHLLLAAVKAGAVKGEELL